MTPKELEVVRISREVYLETANLLKRTEDPVDQAALLYATCNNLHYDLEAIRPGGGFKPQKETPT